MVQYREKREELAYSNSVFTRRLDFITFLKTLLFENKFTNFYSNRKINYHAYSSLKKYSKNSYNMLEIGTSWFPNFIKVLKRPPIFL